MSTVWLLIKREFVERVRQRSFIVATVLGVVLIIGLALIPSMIAGFASSTSTRFIIASPDSSTTRAIEQSLAKSCNIVDADLARSTSADLPPSMRAKLMKGKYDAALIAYRDDQHRLGFAYYPKSANSLQSADDIRASLQRVVLTADVSGSQRDAVEKALKFKFDVHSLNARYKNAEDEFFSQGIV